MRCGGTQRRSRRRYAYAVWAFGVVVLAACSRGRPVPLRIGMSPWPGNEFLFLAAAKGFFAAEGVEVRLIESTSLGDVLSAFDRAEIDGMTGTLADVLESRDRTERAPRAFMALGTSSGTDVILARGGVVTVGAVETIDDVPEALFDVVARLEAAMEPDYVVIGGGGVRHLDELPPGARRGANEHAFTGGFRLWEPEWSPRG